MNRLVRKYEWPLLISNLSAASRRKGYKIAAQMAYTCTEYLLTLRSFLWTQTSRWEMVWTFGSIG